MRRSAGELIKMPMTNNVISKMTAKMAIIARHTSVARVLWRALSSLSENGLKTRSYISDVVTGGYLSSNEAKSSSPSIIHALMIAKKDRSCKNCANIQSLMHVNRCNVKSTFILPPFAVSFTTLESRRLYLTELCYLYQMINIWELYLPQCTTSQVFCTTRT